VIHIFNENTRRFEASKGTLGNDAHDSRGPVLDGGRIVVVEGDASFVLTLPIDETKTEASHAGLVSADPLDLAYSQTNTAFNQVHLVRIHRRCLCPLSANLTRDATPNECFLGEHDIVGDAINAEDALKWRFLGAAAAARLGDGGAERECGETRGD